jgi:hypothetical protein
MNSVVLSQAYLYLWILNKGEGKVSLGPGQVKKRADMLVPSLYVAFARFVDIYSHKSSQRRTNSSFPQTLVGVEVRRGLPILVGEVRFPQPISAINRLCQSGATEMWVCKAKILGPRY